MSAPPATLWTVCAQTARLVAGPAFAGFPFHRSAVLLRRAEVANAEYSRGLH